MEPERYTYEYDNDLSELEKMTENLEEIGRKMGLSKRSLFQIKFAVEEIFVNIISYGYDDEGRHVIQLEVSREDDAVQICIMDDGRPFNPLTAEAPDTRCPIEERQVGGLGLHLTRRLVREVLYQRSGHYNIVTIRADIGCE